MTGKKPMGRPPLSPDGKPRTERVAVNFTEDELRELEDHIEQYAQAHPDERRPSRMAMLHKMWEVFRRASEDPDFDAATYFGILGEHDESDGDELAG